jgi:tetratricopeptide (TPR) repeat protein
MRGRLEWKRDVVPLLPFFAIAIASGTLTTWVEYRFMGAEATDFSLPLVDRCLIAGRAVWFYFYKLLWPADLIFIYPRWHMDATAVWQYLFPAAFLLTFVLFWKLRGRSRGPLAVLLYFAGTLFPILGFFNIYFTRYSFVADHFQYLASLAPIAAAAALVAKATGGLKESLRRPALVLLSGALLSVLFLLSWKQSGMYSDIETLYRTTIARNDNCALAHNNLGLLLMERGRTDEAMTHCLKALDIDPKFGDAHYNVGLLLARMGREDEAIAHYFRALELDANHAKTHNNLASLFEKRGRPDEAMIHYQNALQLDPNHIEAHNNLGALLAKMGRTDEAMFHFARVLEINPNYSDAHFNLGMLAARMRRSDEAMAHYQMALELNPAHAKSHNGLGALLAQTGRPNEAMAHLQRALAINPNYADAHFNLGFLLVEMGRGDEAAAHFRKAMQFNPDAIATLKDRALALARQGQSAAAASVLKRALALAQAVGDTAETQVIAGVIEKI